MNEVPEEYYYYLLASEFGWTPFEIDREDNRTIERLISILVIKSEVEAQELKKNKIK